jgi:hypothetical protein
MVIEDFTNYNIYENRASKFSDGIMYHKMQEKQQQQDTPNPSEGGSAGGSASGGNSERFFYATYNPQTHYSSNRSYYAEGISVSKYENNHSEGSFAHIVNRVRKLFCCG